MQNNKTELKASSQLHTQMNVDAGQNSENSSEELVYRRKLENTPFHVIGTKEEGYFIALGKYRLTEPAITPTAAERSLELDKWDIILKLVITSHQLVVESIQEQTNEQIMENRDKSQVKEYMTDNPWEDTKK